MIGPLVALLAIFGVAVLWIFFNFQPQYANKRQLSVFNWTVVAMCVMFCIGFVLYLYSGLGERNRESFFLPFSIGGALAIEICFLTVGFLLRNFWIFKPPSRPRGGLF